MISRPDFMIISGNGRNTGKTTLACSIIARTSRDYAITAIKISPHMHPSDEAPDEIVRHEHFIIREETSRQGKKDSARMLAAGASRVFYLEVKDEHLEEAFQKLLEVAEITGPVICESGRLRDLIEPSLFILVDRNDGRQDKPGFIRYMPLADMIIRFDGTSYSIESGKVRFDGKKWTIGG